MEVLANVVVIVHLGYFVFVVGGFAGILIGLTQQWPWIYNPWFRFSHFAAVLLIVAEDVFHFPCFLNVLESNLRPISQEGRSEPSAIGRLLDLLLRHTIPGWFLDVMYWTLAVVLLLLLFLIRPHFRKQST